MVKQRLLVAVTAVVLGGLAATGAAFAGENPRVGGERPAAAKRELCDRLAWQLKQKRVAIHRLKTVAAKIQRRIESGRLTDEQKARARKHLARIEALIAKLEQRLERLQAAYEKHCTA